MAKRRDRPVRKRKKLAVPSFGKDLQPIETVAQARKAIEDALYFTGESKQRMYALTTILNRAAAAKNVNPEAWKLINEKRKNIALKDKLAAISKKQKTNKAKPKKERSVRKHPVLRKLSEKTQSLLDSIVGSLENRNFKACRKQIHLAVTDTPRMESRIVAEFFKSRASLAEVKLLSKKNLQEKQDFANTIMMLYAAVGELYKKAGWMEKAEEAFNAADIFKARLRGL